MNGPLRVGTRLGTVVCDLVLALPFYPLQAEPPLSGTASVIDGDTIEFHGRRIRYTASTRRKDSRSAPAHTGRAGGVVSN